MRYKELIEGNPATDQPASDTGLLVKQAAQIRQDCQKFLKEKGPKSFMLYRGMKNQGQQTVIKKRVRLDNRNPADMPLPLHEKLNEYFVDYHGAPFRDALFATGIDIDASQYGAVYSIYPIGDYEFVWSPHLEDLWKEWDTFRFELQYSSNDTDPYVRFMEDVIYKGKWQTTDMKSAISSGNEVMIRCEEYYAVRITNNKMNSNFVIREINK